MFPESSGLEAGQSSGIGLLEKWDCTLLRGVEMGRVVSRSALKEVGRLRKVFGEKRNFQRKN